MTTGLSFDALHSAYASGSLAPTAVVSDIYSKLNPDDGTFIALVPHEDALSRCRSAAVPNLPWPICSRLYCYVCCINIMLLSLIETTAHALQWSYKHS